MIKIRLFCGNGMSTSLMAKRMQEAADARGIEADIAAAAETKMETETEGIDIALIGPQTRYKLNEAKKICEAKNIPVDVISMADYGMMRGDKVLDFALGLLDKQK